MTIRNVARSAFGWLAATLRRWGFGSNSNRMVQNGVARLLEIVGRGWVRALNGYEEAQQ